MTMLMLLVFEVSEDTPIFPVKIKQHAYWDANSYVATEANGNTTGMAYCPGLSRVEIAMN